jgi:hypothetical protein
VPPTVPLVSAPPGTGEKLLPAGGARHEERVEVPYDGGAGESLARCEAGAVGDAGCVGRE